MTEYDTGKTDGGGFDVEQYKKIECPQEDGHRKICEKMKEVVVEMIRSGEFNMPSDTPSEICEGLCSIPANRVFDELDLDHLRILTGGTMTFDHMWLEYKGRHYDPEAPNGVYDYRKLPVLDRRGITSGITVVDGK